MISKLKAAGRFSQRNYSRLTGYLNRHEKVLWPLAVLVVGIVGSLVAWQLWYDLKDDREPVSTTIRNIALIVGGLIAVMLAMWRSRVSERQADTAHQGLLYDRYQRGAQMLGDHALAVRLGGIYALKRLAEDYPEQYHVEVMKLLCAFVRNPPAIPTPQRNILQVLVEISNLAPPHRVMNPLRQDVQAAIEAIGRRSRREMDIEKRHEYTLNLRGADLRGAHLPSVNLGSWREYSVPQEVNPSREPGVTDLTGVFLCSAILTNAILSNADLTRVCLCNSRLSSTDLSGAFLGSAKLHGAHFSKTDISNTKFSMYTRYDPAEGLTQSQINCCIANPDRPPVLLRVSDASTGVQLVGPA